VGASFLLGAGFLGRSTLRCLLSSPIAVSTRHTKWFLLLSSPSDKSRYDARYARFAALGVAIEESVVLDPLSVLFDTRSEVLDPLELVVAE
jgi:hypothetical protein